MSAEHDTVALPRPFVLRDKAELYRRIATELKQVDDALNGVLSDQLGELQNTGKAFRALRGHLQTTARRAHNTQIKLAGAAKAWDALADEVEEILATQRPLVEAYEEAKKRLRRLQLHGDRMPDRVGPGGLLPDKRDTQIRSLEDEIRLLEKKLAFLSAKFVAALRAAKPVFAKFWHIEKPKLTIELPAGIPAVAAGPSSGGSGSGGPGQPPTGGPNQANPGTGQPTKDPVPPDPPPVVSVAGVVKPPKMPMKLWRQAVANAYKLWEMEMAKAILDPDYEPASLGSILRRLIESAGYSARSAADRGSVPGSTVLQ